MVTHLADLLTNDDKGGEVREEMKSPNSWYTGEEHFHDGDIWTLSLQLVRRQSVGGANLAQDLLLLLLLSLLRML